MAELEKLCAELGRTSDPNKVWELECEIERIAELIEEGVCE